MFPGPKLKDKNKENLFDYLDLKNSSAGKSFPFYYIFFQSQRTWYVLNCLDLLCSREVASPTALTCGKQVGDQSLAAFCCGKNIYFVFCSNQLTSYKLDILWTRE